jgi:type IV secretion system protein VirB6
MAQAAAVKFTITGLFDKIGDFGHNYSQQTYQALANAMGGTGVATTLLGSMLTLYLIHYGISVWFGQADASPREIMLRMIRVAVIFALATHWAEFQTYVFNLIDKGPDALGEAMLSLNGTSYTSTSGVRGGLQTFWDTSYKLTDGLQKNAGYLSWGPYIQTGMFLIGVVIFLVIAIGAIMFCKAFIWIALALAPIIIPMALFTYTVRVTMGWITVLLYFFFFQVVVYAYLGFYLSIIDTYSVGIQSTIDQAEVTWGTILPFVLMAYGGVVTMSAIPIVVGMLIGSAGVGPKSLGFALPRFKRLDPPPPRDKQPGNANPSLSPPAGGPALSGPSNTPLLSPPARQLAAPPLLLQSPNHYAAEARKLASQIKNNS